MLVVDHLNIGFNYGIFFVITALACHFINQKLKATEGLTKDQVKCLYFGQESESEEVLDEDILKNYKV